MEHAHDMGNKPIPALLVSQAVPAAIGILIMSIYGIVDTIFVGRWVGAAGIAAITVVMPITFLMASIGMSIGVGGASIISRALGADDEDYAFRTFANQIILVLSLVTVFVVLSTFFEDEILRLFGGNGEILPVASVYFRIVIMGVPFLAFAMMSNNVIRAEGRPLIAMRILLIPAIVNIVLDPILIAGFDMGMAGAAWATAVSYVASAGYALYYFFFGNSEMKVRREDLRLHMPIVKEIGAIGSVTFARQGTVSLLAIVLNNTLFVHGGEMGVAVMGIVNRMMMFANFPVYGITQGFVPIAGFNYGAKHWDRVRSSVMTSIKYGTVVAFIIFVGILSFSKSIVSVFTENAELISQAAPAMVIVFLATPLMTLQLVGSAYFQAIGKARPALLLTLTKQGFCLIPLILILPGFFGLQGIWMSFPIADVLSAAITFLFLRNGMKALPRTV